MEGAVFYTVIPVRNRRNRYFVIDSPLEEIKTKRQSQIMYVCAATIRRSASLCHKIMVVQMMFYRFRPMILCAYITMCD